MDEREKRKKEDLKKGGGVLVVMPEEDIIFLRKEDRHQGKKERSVMGKREKKGPRSMSGLSTSCRKSLRRGRGSRKSISIPAGSVASVTRSLETKRKRAYDIKKEIPPLPGLDYHENFCLTRPREEKKSGHTGSFVGLTLAKNNSAAPRFNRAERSLFFMETDFF